MATLEHVVDSVPRFPAAHSMLTTSITSHVHHIQNHPYSSYPCPILTTCMLSYSLYHHFVCSYPSDHTTKTPSLHYLPYPHHISPLHILIGLQLLAWPCTAPTMSSLYTTYFSHSTLPIPYFSHHARPFHAHHAHHHSCSPIHQAYPFNPFLTSPTTLTEAAYIQHLSSLPCIGFITKPIPLPPSIQPHPQIHFLSLYVHYTHTMLGALGVEHAVGDKNDNMFKLLKFSLLVFDIVKFCYDCDFVCSIGEDQGRALYT